MPGGGVALLKATAAITAKGENDDQEAGIPIVRRALQAPIRQIAENAGVEGSIVVGKVLEARGLAFGYDAQKDEYGDLIEKGIIDPAKVVRTALQDAASIAGLLITTEAGVAEAPKKKDAHAGHSPWRHGRHGRNGYVGRCFRALPSRARKGISPERRRFGPRAAPRNAGRSFVCPRLSCRKRGSTAFSQTRVAPSSRVSGRTQDRMPPAPR